MTFRVVSKSSNNHVRCPYRIIEQSTGREIDWINKYLDYETLRRLADTTLRSYAHELLHFLRWWESVHHTDVVTKDDLTESTLLDYVDGVVDSLLFAQHTIEMFRRSLTDGAPKHRLDQLANRLTKILAETRKLNPTG